MGFCVTAGGTACVLAGGWCGPACSLQNCLAAMEAITEDQDNLHVAEAGGLCATMRHEQGVVWKHMHDVTCLQAGCIVGARQGGWRYTAR